MFDYFQLMLPGKNYHAFNQGNNRERIFYDDYDKTHFLQNLHKYMDNVWYFYTYSLAYNHFHCVVQVKSLNDILLTIKSDSRIKKFVKRIPKNDKVYLASRIVSEYSRLFFMSYANYFNFKYKDIRSGAVFRKFFRRVFLETQDQLRDCIIYVDSNITKHNPDIDYKEYKWTGYHDFFNENILQEKINDFFDFAGIFGDFNNFLYLHKLKEEKLAYNKLK